MPRLSLAAAAALAGLGLSAPLGVPPAAACGWLWPCADRSAYRDAPSAAYRGCPGRRRAYGCRGAGGYGYAPWLGTSLRARSWQPRTALAGESTREVGLTPPITSGQGLLYSAMPAYGPTLFGPPPPPPGYYYGGGYDYGSPGYGYYGYVPRGGPPPETPSWWVEPRRRR